MASTSLKPGVESPKLKTKPNVRLRKRKISKPRKRVDISEIVRPETASSGVPESHPRRIGADAGNGLSWLTRTSGLPTTMEGAVREQGSGEPGDKAPVTPKKENVQGYVEDEWVELGPSVHKEGHSPSYSDRSFGQTLALKTSPDSLKGNGVIGENVDSAARQLDLDLPSNEDTQTSKEMKVDKGKDDKWSALGETKLLQYRHNASALSSSAHADVGTSGQSCAMSQLSPQTFSFHCNGHVQLMYRPCQCNNHEANVSSAVSPGNEMYINSAQSCVSGKGPRSSSCATTASRPAEYGCLKANREQVKPLLEALSCFNTILPSNPEMFERQKAAFLAQLPHYVAGMPASKSRRPEIAGHVRVGAQSVLSLNTATSGGGNTAGNVPTVKPRMSGGEDFVDPTRIKFGLDDDEVTDDELIRVIEREGRVSSDEEWKPYKINGRMKTAQNYEGLSVIKLQNESGEMKKRRRRRRRSEESVKQNVNCPTCGKHFRGKYQLRRHEMSHSEHRPFVCLVCKKSFKQKAHLHGHMAVHKYSKTEPENAGVKPNNKVQQPAKCIGRPKKIYTEKELSCKDCGKCFKTVYRLKRHEQSHTDDRPFTCRVCGKGFKQTGHRNEHESNHEKNSKKSFLCNMCGVVFRCRSSFNNHMRSHNVEKARLVLGRPDGDGSVKPDWPEITHTGYDCPYCPDKFATAQALNNHLETHVEVKHRRHVQPYSCDVCKRTFTYRHNLIKHKLVHKAPEKYAQFYKDKIEAHVASGKPSYRCTECDKVYIRKETLAKHYKIHSGTKPFKCSICFREFTQNVHLKVHMRKHTGSRPFQCKECNRGFIDSTALAKHIEYEACNAENAIYRCKVCEKRHYYLGSIKQHIRKQHGITHEESVEKHILKFERLNKRKLCGDLDKFACKICSKYFTEKCNLVRHVRNKHSDLINLLSTERSSYCEEQSVDCKYSQTTSKNTSSAEDEFTLCEEKFRAEITGELVIDECRGGEDLAVPAPDMHGGAVQNHTAARAPGGEDLGRAVIKVEHNAMSDGNDKLLEGFNTAGFDCLDDAATAGAHSAFLSRTQSPVHGAVCPGISSDGQDNKETSLHSDINFLYNIGLIVSSKGQKYNVGLHNDARSLHNDTGTRTCSSEVKHLRQQNSEQMNAQNRNPEASLMSSNTCAKQEMIYKPCLNSCMPESQEGSGNWHYLSQENGEDKNFMMSSKENGFSLISRDHREASPFVQPEFTSSSQRKLTGKDDFSREASPESLNGSPSRGIARERGGNESRTPQASERPTSSTDVHSASCVAFTDLTGKDNALLQRIPEVDIKLLMPKHAPELACIDFLDTESAALETNVSSVVHCQSVSNDAKNNTVNISNLLDTLGNNSNVYLSPCCGSPSKSSGSQSASGKSERTDRPLHLLSRTALTEQFAQFELPDDDYESCPTESQLKCLGLLACRDSREVASKNCSIDVLYSKFKPWLQELVCSSRSKRLKEKSGATPPGEISDIGAIKVEGESSPENYVDEAELKAAAETTGKRKCAKRADVKGTSACQQVSSRFSAVETPSPKKQCVAEGELNTSADFWMVNGDHPPTVEQADPATHVMNGSPSSVGSRGHSGRSATFSYASSMTDTTPPTTPDSTSRGKGSFSCSVCAKVFSARHQLKRHELTHTDQRPYNCDKCGRAFRQKVHLSDHTKRHQGERPFTCEGCGKRFVLKNEMNQHMKHHCKVAATMMIRSSVGKSTHSVLRIALGQMAPVSLGGAAPATTRPVAENGYAKDYNVKVAELFLSGE